MNKYKISTFLTLASLVLLISSCAENTDIKEAKKPMEKTMTKVTITTSFGDIRLELNDEKAPITVDNFKKIAQSGYYEGTIFHRVIGI